MFLNKAHQQQFDTDGYVKIPVLTAACVSQLNDFFSSLHLPVAEGTKAVNYEGQDKQRDELIVAKVQEVFLPRLATVLGSDYFMDGGTFITKSVGDNSECKIHQDWNMLDETKHTSAIAWCPLIDVNQTNGALQAVKGSHRLFPTLRSVNIVPLYLPIDDRTEPYLTCLEAKAGEVIFFSHRLFHGSKPNHQNQTRVAAVFGVLPKAATRLHYLRTNIRGADEVCVFEVDAAFYYNNPFGYTLEQAMQAKHYFIPWQNSYAISEQQFFETLERQQPAGWLQKIKSWI